MVQVAFDMEIGDLVDSQIMQLYPFEFARDLYRKFIGESKSEIEEPQPQASQPTPAATPEQTVNVQNVQPACRRHRICSRWQEQCRFSRI